VETGRKSVVVADKSAGKSVSWFLQKPGHVRVRGRTCLAILSGIRHKPSGNCPSIFWKTGRFIDVPGFTVPLSSPVRFGWIFLIFADFYRFFQKPTGSVMSGFRGSVISGITKGKNEQRTQDARRMIFPLKVKHDYNWTMEITTLPPSFVWKLKFILDSLLI
jgi:hypothetical protein